MDEKRLSRLLRACGAAAQAEGHPPERLTFGPQDEFLIEREGDGLNWSLSASFRNGQFEEAFFCEAVEKDRRFRVTSVESPAWWTPPPF